MWEKNALDPVVNQQLFGLQNYWNSALCALYFIWSLVSRLKNKIHRSLDLESFNIHVAPTTSKFSLPTIVRFYPPTVKPLHQHANMPLRFGRQSHPSDERTPNSSPNLPQRFGRSWVAIRVCAECPSIRRVPNQVLSQRFERNSPYWKLLRTVAIEQLLNTGLHW